MDKFTRTTIFFDLFCILAVLQLPSTAGEGGQNVAQNQPEKPFLSKILLDTVSLLKNSHKNSWEKIKTVVHDLQMQFSPPNLDFRSANKAEPGHGGGDDGVKEKVTEAAGKSFDKSKEAVEDSAKSAAKVVEEVVQKTATHGSEKDESKTEL
ncbi:hypothetical protein L6164_012320 [Bauhinia variegata]|uniref:Uncharacterized protein n=1 Tax=Bauhinia variegata TaxID=167791 RepID=A0ACB9PEV7_BAUVA|nr:hypothetical protein L6164_012320 [Bauhinia variegata]